MADLHRRLLSLVPRLPSDFEPYGRRVRAEGAFDCSCGCRWFQRLEGEAGHDRGVCMNPGSPRAALLTFEHQGCDAFDAEDGSDDRTAGVR